MHIRLAVTCKSSLGANHCGCSRVFLRGSMINCSLVWVTTRLGHNSSLKSNPLLPGFRSMGGLTDGQMRGGRETGKMSLKIAKYGHFAGPCRYS